MAPLLKADLLKPAVRDIFLKFNEPFEGRCNFMYLDQRCLVTTGVGNLIDPISAALSLPWLNADMSHATQAEIVAAWNAVKARKDLAVKGGGIFRTVTSLRLTDGAIDQLVMGKMAQMSSYLQNSRTFFGGMPADAQLAVLSMSWALGPAFRFPKFWAALSKGDFVGAADESHIEAGQGSTLVRRNLVNKLLLVNAARARAFKLDESVLYWPKILPPSSPVPQA